MLVSRFRVACATLLLSSGLVAVKVFAGDAAENTDTANTNIPPLQTVVRLEGGPNLLPTHVAYVTAGTNKFGFALPDGLHLITSDPGKVTMVSADYNSLLTWQIVGPAPTNGAELDPEEYRKPLMSRHPGGKIIAEYQLVAGGKRGPAFEMRWSGQGGLERQELAAYVTSAAGVVEFDLVSSLEKYGIGRRDLNTIMLTFRCADENGKLVMPVFSDRL